MTGFKRLIPKYAIIPTVILLLVIPVYFEVRLVNINLPHHNVSLGIDEMIPFVHVFVWIYVLAYVQWFIGYFVIAHDSESLCKTYFPAEVICRIMCALVFIVFPTLMVRPEIVGEGLTEKVLAWIYEVDRPDNLFPSLHCVESWLVARGMMETKVPKTAKTSMWIFTILVFASVLLVKQHLVLDVAGGILVAEISIYLSKKLKVGRIYDFLERKLGLNT